MASFVTKTIPELEETTTVQNEDYMVIYSGSETKKVSAGKLIDLVPQYDGSVTVKPMADSLQKLTTKNKYVDTDILVESIPYSEVDNPQGGKTVTIGGY